MNTTKLQLRMKTAIASTAAILALIGGVATVGCSADSNATDSEDVYAKCIQGTPLQKFEVCVRREQECETEDHDDGRRDINKSERLACEDNCRVQSGCKADQKGCDDTRSKCLDEEAKAAEAAGN